MKFGPATPSACEGAILAHAVYLPDGRLRKGSRLSVADIARLEAAGVETVTVAFLEPGDIDEDSAADRLAAVLVPAGPRLSSASTGRVNIYAVGRGLVRFDRDRLKRLNRIDEGITLACVQHNQLVEDGDMIATLKIIPYSLPEKTVEAAITAAGGVPVFSFHPLATRPFALIQTRMDGMKPALLTATEKVTKQRLDQLGCALVDSRVVDHDAASLEAAISESVGHGAEAILICGASAISDRRDVVPMAVEAAGGSVHRLGLPADPGNLLMMAGIGDMPVIGMPGCARSARLNGFDWVLQLVLAGIEIDEDEIADMAIGGLLMEIASRPLPRKMVERRRPTNIVIGGVLLAAGSSQRMGEVNKLLVEIEGQPMVRHAATAMIQGGIRDLVVVTGHQQDKVREALGGLEVTFIHNADFAVGQAGSVAAGVGSLPDGLSGALIALGDMPFVTADLVAEMIRDHSGLGDGETRISFPVHEGRRGNPVLWGRGFFDALRKLSGDVGGRTVLAANPAAVNSIGWHDDSIHRDIDTPMDLS
ncbi:MAG: molybdopterin-binding/glycosyltransferase family 2 protein [Pseudomonadota bacterium]|nr:molybdopterin-binding/glycosyltransferase family 2 protein [Pseudomonadota bacterium]